MDIFKDGALFDLDVRYWSSAKNLTAEDLGLKQENVVEAYKLGRKMLIPTAVIKKFRALESQARHVLKTNSFKFPIGNARFIPKKKLVAVLEALKKIQAKYNTKIDELLLNYKKYRLEMIPIYTQAAEVAFRKSTRRKSDMGNQEYEDLKASYIKQFLARIQEYYPDVDTLRGKFGLDWTVYEIALPKLRKTDADSLVAAEDKKLIAEEEYRLQAQQKIGNFVEEVVVALRQETVSLCDKIITNIKEGKVVKGKTLNALKDFIDNFSELNFVGDARIEEELMILKKDFLDVYSKEEKVEDIQDELNKRLGTLIKIASKTTDINAVTGEYKRRISW